MNQLIIQTFLITFILNFPTFIITQNVLSNVRYDVGEVKCLVCHALVDELLLARSALSKDIKVPVGRYNLDTKENERKSVPLYKSEVRLAEMIDAICERFDDYVKGKRQSDGKLMVIPMTLSNGGMNPEISTVGLIQDSDLNKSLRFYCESITEEYEEVMIKHLVNETKDFHNQICSKESKICSSEDDNEHYSPSENDEL